MTTEREIPGCPLTIIESPFSQSGGSYDLAENIAYARLACRDALSRGEAPIASHLLHTQYLLDEVETDRCIGIDAGLAWYRAIIACNHQDRFASNNKVAFYCDFGISDGMTAALQLCIRESIPHKMRLLPASKMTLLDKHKGPFPPEETAIGV